jgi:hypothetical protein
MSIPYPHFPPNYPVVRETGGYARDCIIIDILSLGTLDPERRAILEDKLSMVLGEFSEIEKHDMVNSERFNTELQRALRL